MMTPGTLELLADLLSQVTLSATLPPDELEDAARRVATAQREVAAALAGVDQ